MIAPELHLVETFDDAEAFMRWLSERRQILACDTETGGFEWWREPLRLVQFGDLDSGWAIPWQRWGGLAADALVRYTGALAFHNLKFDMHFLEQNGAWVGRSRVHDTRTLAHLLDPESSTALKSLGVRYVDASADSGQHALKAAMSAAKWTWATVPVTLPSYWAYAALDPVLTAHLYQHFRPRVTGALNDVYELEVACQIVLADMESRGARLDVPYCESRRVEMLTFAAETRHWCVATYGFAPGSLKSVAAQLQRDGVVLTKRTASGGWSLDESVLVGIEHPLAQAALNVRKAEKTANAFLGNWVGMADGELLHPTVNPLGARTGRMSVSRPALQQIPRSKVLRDAFVPRDGNMLVSVDYDQIEQRLLCHLSGDKGMAAAFAEDGDFFTNLARTLYSDATIEKSDPRRQTTKSASYAKAYGAGAEKFAATAGLPVATAHAFLSAYDRAFPDVRAFQNRVAREAVARGASEECQPYAVTPLGRRQPVDSETTYKLVNYLIQGAAADIFKQALVDLDRAGLAEHLVLPVHDEAVFDVPADDAVAFATEAAVVMQRNDFLVPLTAGGDVLSRWGDKYAVTN